jgi:spore coat protein JB
MGDEKVNHINYFDNTYNNVGNKKPNPKNNKFLGIMEGYVLGNMEKGTYIPYKNYKPVLANNYSAKDGLLMTIEAYEFACTDLGLYLDVNPNDKEALMLFKDYKQKLEDACALYSEQYSPLTLDENVASSTWEWIKPWPFERGES